MCCGIGAHLFIDNNTLSGKAAQNVKKKQNTMFIKSAWICRDSKEKQSLNKSGKKVGSRPSF
jgi:hypothetical protein